MELFLIIVALVCIAAAFFLSNRQGGSNGSSAAARKFAPILDNFTSLTQVQKALRESGLEASQLIIGVDYTQSNEWQGKRSFGGQNLHTLGPKDNPYQQVLKVIGETLSVFDEDGMIPCFGFGDAATRDQNVFPFNTSGEDCNGLSEVLERYKQVTSRVQLSGPTSFAPLIRKAINIVRESREYHILLIVADGQVSSEADTVRAIVEATKYPLSIVMVGVGDGPWDKMEEFDDRLPQRAFDNFQFVDFSALQRKHPGNQAAFALNALMEIPEQYQMIRKLGLM